MTMSDIGAYLALRDSIAAWDRCDREAPVLVTLRTGALLELRRDVPATRADCPKTRPCGHVRCREHLWVSLGNERRGRTAKGYRMAPELFPGWLEDPPPPSCALDIAESVKPGEEADLSVLAQALRKTEDWVRRLLRRAIRKAPEVMRSKGIEQ